MRKPSFKILEFFQKGGVRIALPLMNINFIAEREDRCAEIGVFGERERVVTCEPYSKVKERWANARAKVEWK